MMKAHEPQQPIRNLGLQPHTWGQAAEHVMVAELREPLRSWLLNSGLPGTEEAGDGASWKLEDRIRFLKALCGEGP